METASILLSRMLFLLLLIPSLVLASGTGTHGEKPLREGAGSGGTGTHGESPRIPDNPQASGTGTHGGNHIKNRFLLAKDFAQGVLDNVNCQKVFTKRHCQSMSQKLSSSPMAWFQKEDTCLKARVRGVSQCVTAKTTPEKASAIVIDVNAAAKTKIGFKEAVILLIHEAGHSVGLSDALITDQRITLILPRDLMVEDREIQDVSWAREGAGSLEFCKGLQAAMERTFDLEVAGTTGAYRVGKDIAQDIRTDHVDMFKRIMTTLTSTVLKQLQQVHRQKEDVESQIEMRRLALAQILVGDLVTELKKRGLWYDLTLVIDPGVDTNKHSVQLFWKEQSVDVRICTYMIQDAQFANATRISACSTMLIEDGKVPTALSITYFDESPQLYRFEIRGRMVDLRTLPNKEETVMKQIGKTCEAQLKVGHLLQVKP